MLDEATYVIVLKEVSVVLVRAFYEHQKIVEVICHDVVERIEEDVFFDCPSLEMIYHVGRLNC